MTDFLKEAFDRAQVGSSAVVAFKAREQIRAVSNCRERKMIKPFRHNMTDDLRNMYYSNRASGDWMLNNCPCCENVLEYGEYKSGIGFCDECKTEWGSISFKRRMEP